MHGFRLGKVDPEAEVLFLLRGTFSVYKLIRYSSGYGAGTLTVRSRCLVLAESLCTTTTLSLRVVIMYPPPICQNARRIYPTLKRPWTCMYPPPHMTCMYPPSHITYASIYMRITGTTNAQRIYLIKPKLLSPNPLRSPAHLSNKA